VFRLLIRVKRVNKTSLVGIKARKFFWAEEKRRLLISWVIFIFSRPSGILLISLALIFFISLIIRKDNMLNELM